MPDGVKDKIVPSLISMLLGVVGTGIGFYIVEGTTHATHEEVRQGDASTLIAAERLIASGPYPMERGRIEERFTRVMDGQAAIAKQVQDLVVEVRELRERVAR